MQPTKSADLIGHIKFLPWQQLYSCSVTRPFLSVKGVACETRRHARFIFIVSEKVEVLSELVNPISITNQWNTGLSPQDGEPQELQ